MAWEQLILSDGTTNLTVTGRITTDTLDFDIGVRRPPFSNSWFVVGSKKQLKASMSIELKPTWDDVAATNALLNSLTALLPVISSVDWNGATRQVYGSKDNFKIDNHSYGRTVTFSLACKDGDWVVPTQTIEVVPGTVVGVSMNHSGGTLKLYADAPIEQKEVQREIEEFSFGRVETGDLLYNPGTLVLRCKAMQKSSIKGLWQTVHSICATALVATSLTWNAGQYNLFGLKRITRRYKHSHIAIELEFVPSAPGVVLAMTPTTLPKWQIGIPFGVALRVNGVGTPTFTLHSGTLPTGLSLLTTPYVRIEGTPTVTGTFTFVIRAVDSAGNIVDKSYSVEITNLTDTTPPGIPSNVSVTAGNAQMAISWDNPTDGDLYRIEISYTHGTTTVIEVVEDIPQPYEIFGLTNGTPVTNIRLRAKDDSLNFSGYTSPLSVTPNTAKARTPTGLSIVLAATKPRLTWQNPPSEIWTNIKVYRAVGAGSYALLATISGDASDYTDNAVSAGVSYLYYLVAVQTGLLDSDQSVKVGVKTPTGAGLGRAKVLIHFGPAEKDAGLWNAATMNGLAGEAFSITLQNGWEFFRPDVSFTAAEIQASLAQFNSITKEKFLGVYHKYDPPNPMTSSFTSGYYAAWLNKWTAFALAAKNSGFTGILYDEENYDPTEYIYDEKGKVIKVIEAWADDWMQYQGTYYAGYTQAAVDERMRELGQLVGNAIASVWPTCKFIMFHPPDTGYPPSQNVSTDPQYGWPIGNPKRVNLPVSTQRTAGALFQCGVLQALHPTGGMVQGSGEIFVLRSFEEFRRSYNYRKNVLLPNIPNVPSGFRSTYVNNLKLAFFVGDFSFEFWMFKGTIVEMNPQKYVTTLRNAIDNSDDDSYVIAYMQTGSEQKLIRTGTWHYLDSIKEALEIY